jgi:TFIIF-interacting CTD phosphatase-like protein
VGMQDLSRLGRDLARTVLVDDSPSSFLMQPSNGLPIRPFTGQSCDNDLLTVRSLTLHLMRDSYLIMMLGMFCL